MKKIIRLKFSTSSHLGVFKKWAGWVEEAVILIWMLL